MNEFVIHEDCKMTTTEMITAIAEDGSYYPAEKLDTHVRNLRHVAISVFVFNAGRLLLQKRAAVKYHSGLLWANTCCSHPRWRESPEECAPRRLREELGWSLPVQKFGEISYSADVGNGLFENEVAHCFAARAPADIPLDSYDPEEVAELEWADLKTIDERLKSDPGRFSKWFQIYMTRHRPMIANLMAEDAGYA